MTRESSEHETSIDEMQNFIVTPNQMRRPPYTDRDMWIAIRSGLLGIVKALDDFYSGNPFAVAVRASLLGIISAIEMRWNLRRHKTN
jgi:hypothetical protein